MIDKYTLTQEGVEALEQELRNLVNVERPIVLQEIEEARGYGDLSENADYDAARNKQGNIESRIIEIERILANKNVVEFSKTSKTVSVGNYVLIHDTTYDETFSFRILGQFEGKPLAGTISIDAPIAEAILGRKVGDRVVVKAQNPYEVQILNISTEPIV
ncbi:MAG: transcription elongation factor GreA [Bacilli bacterium]